MCGGLVQLGSRGGGDNRQTLLCSEAGHGVLDRFDWEVVVVEDKTPNAFVLPGGKIVVFTGERPHEPDYR